MEAGRDPESAMERGMRKMTTTLTRWMPDYDEAASCFERAATAFRLRKQYLRASEAYERASQVRERLGEPRQAGKHMEACGTMLVEERRRVREVSPREGGDAGQEGAGEVSLDFGSKFTEAAELFALAGNEQAAAEALMKGGEHEMEEGRSLKAYAAYDAAADQLCEAGAGAEAPRALREAARAAVEGGAPALACAALVKLASLHSARGQVGSMCKAYLCCVTAWVAAGKVAEARMSLGDFVCVDGFEGSAEGDAAVGLVDAFASGERGRVKAAVGHDAFRYLDNFFANLARRLPVPGTLPSRPGAAHSHSQSQSQSQSQSELQSQSQSHSKDDDDDDDDEDEGLM